MSVQVNTASTAAVPATETIAINTAAIIPPPSPEQQQAPEKDQFADRLELLSRKERALFHRNMQIKQEAQKLAAEKAEYEKFRALKSKAKTNPMDYLSEAGLSYDEITQYVLNGGKATEKDELQALRDEFKALRDEQAQEKEQQKNQQTQAQKQAESQAIEGFKEEIAEFVEANKTTYELSSMRDATDDIYSTINDAYVIRLNEWNKNGRIGRPPGPMAIKEAADIVEEFYEKEVSRLAESNKMKSRLNPQPTDPDQPRKEAPKTLTNNMASTAASLVPAKNDQDRMQRAMAKLSGG